LRTCDPLLAELTAERRGLLSPSCLPAPGNCRGTADDLRHSKRNPMPIPVASSRPPSTMPLAAASTPEAAGERRHVTVMFCDLVER
jgi:hypothetical protein